MSYKVKKRNGDYVNYNPEKILKAIRGANNSLGEFGKAVPERKVQDIYEDAQKEVLKLFAEDSESVTVEKINDIVEVAIMKNDCYLLAKVFIEYRY